MTISGFCIPEGKPFQLLLIGTRSLLPAWGDVWDSIAPTKLSKPREATPSVVTADQRKLSISHQPTAPFANQALRKEGSPYRRCPRGAVISIGMSHTLRQIRPDWGNEERPDMLRCGFPSDTFNPAGDPGGPYILDPCSKCRPNITTPTSQVLRHLWI